jgi:hypothetical protein
LISTVDFEAINCRAHRWGSFSNYQRPMVSQSQIFTVTGVSPLSSSRRGSTHLAADSRGRAHSYGLDLTSELQLIGFNLDRAARCSSASRRAGGLPGAACRSRPVERNGASSQLSYRWRLWKRNPSPISEQAQTERTQSEHWALPGNLQYPELSRRPVQMPPPGSTDCGPGGRRGTIP